MLEVSTYETAFTSSSEPVWTYTMEKSSSVATCVAGGALTYAHEASGLQPFSRAAASPHL